MWANHTWTNIHPYRGGIPKVRIDGKAYFSFYKNNLLKKSLSGKDAVNQALKDFRVRAKVGDLHLNIIVGEISFLPGEDLSHGYEEINDLILNNWLKSIVNHLLMWNSIDLAIKDKKLLTLIIANTVFTPR